MPPARSGYSLVEVLVASGVFVMALIPAISLLNSSSAETVKSRDRAVALQLASAVTESLRSLPALQRAGLPPTPAAQLGLLKPNVDAHKRYHPEVASPLDATLANFVCQAALTGGPGVPAARVQISWKEAGETRTFVVETRLEGP